MNTLFTGDRSTSSSSSSSSKIWKDKALLADDVFDVFEVLAASGKDGVRSRRVLVVGESEGIEGSARFA